MPYSNPLSFSEVPANDKQVKCVSDAVDILTFKLDPVVWALVGLVRWVEPLDHDPFFVSEDTLVELFKDLLHTHANLSSHDFQSVRNLFDNLGEYDLPILQSSSHQVDFLAILTMTLDIEDVEYFVAYLQVIVSVLISLTLKASHCYLLVHTKRRYLLFVIIPNNHLAIQYCSLSIYTIFNMLWHFWPIDASIVVGVSCKKFHNTILKMALNSLTIKLSFNNDTFRSWFSYHFCNLLRIQFGR